MMAPMAMEKGMTGPVVKPQRLVASGLAHACAMSHFAYNSPTDPPMTAPTTTAVSNASIVLSRPSQTCVSVYENSAPHLEQTGMTVQF